MNLPKYTSKDYQVLLWVVVPFTIILNTFIFGQLYYNNLVGFVSATLITAVACCIDFILCGFVAVELKHRFPKEKQMATRLSIIILFFIILTGLFLFSLYKGYEMFGFYNYTFNEFGFIWSYVAMGILNIFLTFLHEGISRYEEWKA